MTGLYPEVAILVAAYNEADCVLEKVQNCFELDYPREKLVIHFVTDGSTDDSVRMLEAIDDIYVHHAPERKGKLAAVERAIKFVNSPIVVLTDANCLLNKAALKKIVRHYQDPKIGGVAGEKSIRKESTGSAAGSGEGLYWKYESWLKKTDSDLHSVVGAAGELFSFRRSLFEELPANTIIEDFILSMRIAMKGYKVVYEPGAVASELPSASIKEEWKRKVRICAGGFQSLRYLPGIWNPLQFGWLSIQFLSHRFLRWSVIPFLLPVMLIVLGVLSETSSFYMTLFVGVSTILATATGALLLADTVKVPKIMLIPGYIIMLNAAAYVGLFRYWKGTQQVTWEKAKRLDRKTQLN